MKQKFFRSLQKQLFLKYIMIIVALCIGGALCLYLFDNVLNGIIIDFLRVLLINTDPFKMFRNIFSVFLPVLIIITGFLLVYFLCKDLSKYMRYLMEGIDDVMLKKRNQLSLPKEMKQTENILRGLAEEYSFYEKGAKEDEEKKKDLIYLLAQDIKMPLSNIEMYLDFIQKEKGISEELRKDFIRQVLFKSMDLEDMINEFFDITRFNLQYAKWNPETMYLDRMMEQVLDEAYTMIEEKNIRLAYSCSVSCPIYADSEKIARAMRDLIRNLIELGKEGSTLHVELKQSKKTYEICLDIDAFHLNSYQIAHIFHNYYRLEDMKQTNSKHVLGLGVAKAIMDMHKGFVRASSIGEHIRFYVVLPVTEESKKKDV